MLEPSEEALFWIVHV